ncbi:MAG: hypothetical protein KDK76_06380 [Chlamydiia bacterium]|nr:hypothetical protein [Chlamydiia bacterium]
MGAVLQPVAVPHFKDISLQSQENSLLSITVSDAGSTVMRMGRYAVLACMKLNPQLTPDAVNTFTIMQKSLNDGGSIETLLSTEEATQNFIKGAHEIREAYNNPTNKITAVAGTILLNLAYAIQKADSVLWSIDNFGFVDGLFAHTLHGAGFMVSVYLAARDYQGVEEAVRDIADSDEKKRLVFIKQVKFALSALTALVGLNMFLAATKALVLLWLGLAFVVAAISIVEHFLESRLRPDDSDLKRIEKARKVPPTIILS